MLNLSIAVKPTAYIAEDTVAVGFFSDADPSSPLLIYPLRIRVEDDRKNWSVRLAAEGQSGETKDSDNSAKVGLFLVGGQYTWYRGGTATPAWELGLYLGRGVSKLKTRIAPTLSDLKASRLSATTDYCAAASQLIYNLPQAEPLRIGLGALYSVPDERLGLDLSLRFVLGGWEGSVAGGWYGTKIREYHFSPFGFASCDTLRTWGFAFGTRLSYGFYR